jgi:hypothetical protein
MISFKEFIQERAVDAKPDWRSVSIEKAAEFVKKHCPSFTGRNPIYRGEHGLPPELIKTGVGVVDTSATSRESENTSNYYTVIFDNHPEMTNFPKRSKSFIASADYETAKGFTYGDSRHEMYVVIPTSSTKIGVCPKEDMWMTEIKLFGETGKINTFNKYFKWMGIEPTIQGFLDFDKKLKDNNASAMLKLQQELGTEGLKYKDNFMESIWEAYSPKNTGMAFYTPATLPILADDNEVWVSGICMCVTMKMIDDFEEAYAKL